MIQIMLIYDWGIFSIHKKNIDGPSQQGQAGLIPNDSLVLSDISSMKTSTRAPDRDDTESRECCHCHGYPTREPQ